MSRSYTVVVIALLLLPAPGWAQQARLIVIVSDYHEVPVPDVLLRVWDSRKQTIVATGSTDYEGTAVLEVKPFEHYEIQATRERFRTEEANNGRRSLWPVAGDISVQFRLAPEDVVLSPPASDGVTTAPLSPKGILTGLVISPTGSPLPDVAVNALPAETGVYGNTRSDRHGRYRVSLFPGTYRVMTSSQHSAPPAMWSTPIFTGYEGKEVTVNVTSGRETRVDLVLVAVSLFNVRVSVIDEIGDVVSGANVRLVGDSVDTLLPTDPDGSVRLGPQAPGAFQLSVLATKDGRYLSGSMPIRVRDAPVDVTVQLMASAAVSGWVQFIGRLSPLHSDGGLRVFGTAPGSAPHGFSNLDPSGVVSASGEFTLPVATGEQCLGLSGIPWGWRLLDITYNGEDYTHRPFPLASGDHLAGVTIRVEPGNPESGSRRCHDR